MLLAYIIENIDNVQELVAPGRKAFVAAKHDHAAALYYLQTVAESTQRLSDAIKATHPEIDWSGISGFRNRLVHGYLQINIVAVWNIIENNLPALKEAAQAMLQALDATENETDETG